ncbi:MAG TPA: DarT ssDNA thymidine ADP-ribosyltransferase family protein [Gemmataceae bacterium]|nr:DarT ssDNA thymidine ADP-ribosyltransferase family protein [Gemmataceae bacterium]
MSVPPEFRDRHAYQFLHIDNLPSALKHGLLCTKKLQRRGIQCRSVASPSIQQTRSKMVVPCGPGGVVHDYVPFYLCKRSSMLLSVLNTKNVDQQLLIYLAIPIAVVEKDHVVFTDAAANRPHDPPNFYTVPKDLRKLNWDAITCMKWTAGSDSLNHARMAEVLVHKRVDMADVAFIVVWNESVADRVRDIYAEAKLTAPMIRFDSWHYFMKYPQNPDQSLVTGPYFTKMAFEETIASIFKKLGKGRFCRFPTLGRMLTALRRDIRCVPETAELDGLKIDNPMHPYDLGTHTKRVAECLRGLPEYSTLNSTDQLLVELAAYFHDIGKGPKKRWKSRGGKYQVDRDHPLFGLSMIERILTKDVQKWARRSAKLICKLVCYHDLVGDILAKGRDESQLVEIVDDERELDMLIALAKADALAVHSEWWNDAKATELRDRIVAGFQDAG